MYVMEMILNKYHVTITDSTDKLVMCVQKSAFSEEEAINYARTTHDQRYIGRHDRLPIYPLKFKAEIWQEPS